MELPTISSKLYKALELQVCEACEAVGDASQKRALLEEKRLAYEAGVLPDAAGRFGVPISFDAQCLKPTSPVGP